MKTINILLFMLLGVQPVHAQEFVDWKFTAGEASNSNVVTPIDVTVETSTSNMEYNFNRLLENISTGELVTKLAFKGYNLGNAQTRHVKVWLSNRFTKNAKCLFDGDCTIPHGGSAGESITLLDLPLDEPYKYQGEENTCVMIESTGAQAGQPLVFENHDGSPVVTITAKSEVAYFTGTVRDQDGNAVKGACVNIYRNRKGADALSYSTATDSEGCYTVRVEHGCRSYCLTVSAAGYPDYMVDWPFQLCDGTNMPAPSGDIIMTGRIDFRAGQQATIILPEAPDPSWGRYYRLDRRSEEYAAIFVREFTPQANVPYVIFPEEDFSIDLSSYDRDNLPEAGCMLYPDSDENMPLGLFGTYQSRIAHCMGILTASLLDSTPDCQAGSSNCFPRVGAFRAYLVGINSGSQYNDDTKIMFVGGTDTITEVTLANNHIIPHYDLQGRRVTGTPQRGIYIRDGRKYVK